ncbi:strawberry notch family protein [Mesorhizobium sp. M1312]|uniref:hypothetical protein n=1 Tax=unclassified Mesorhizobium TaxID=325217 RepID=UPI00333D1395
MNIVSTTPAVARTAAPLHAPTPASINNAEAIYQAAMQLLPFLEQGEPVTTAALRTAMTTSFGGSDAQGLWVWKDAYEALEVAQVLFLRRFGPAILSRSTTPQATLAMIKRIADLLPTHTRRSDESQAMQQLSTPLPLAFVTAHAAAIASCDLVLEPSAGTGLLAVHADIASLILNEFAATRADLLALLFPRVPVSRHDAGHIDDHLDAAMEPSVVLMNPPFTVGLYTARSLSYDGVEYDLLEHALIEEQIRIYNAYSDAFQVIHNNLTAALEATNITSESGTLNHNAKSAARSAFESTRGAAVQSGFPSPTNCSIWRRLPDHDCQVYRIQTDAGERIIGRHIAPTLVATMLRNLGLDHVPTLAPDEAWTGLVDGRIGLQLADGLILRRSRVMNDYRVELLGFTDAMVPRLKALGLISEIISWKLRLFIPTIEQGSAILASLFDRQTLVGVTDRAAAA